LRNNESNRTHPMLLNDGFVNSAQKPKTSSKKQLPVFMACSAASLGTTAGCGCVVSATLFLPVLRGSIGGADVAVVVVVVVVAAAAAVVVVVVVVDVVVASSGVVVVGASIVDDCADATLVV
jgi:hypothetical protein